MKIYQEARVQALRPSRANFWYPSSFPVLKQAL
jgi:hypothetical protein